MIKVNPFLFYQKEMDAVSAHETGMLEASDEEQLSYAAAEGRAMVTRSLESYTIEFLPNK